MSKINKLFDDKHIVIKIQQKLPKLFQLAENENTRYGSLGMEIGSARERIVIALLIHEFGEDNVKTNIAVTEKETDVIVFNKPISIKTFTNKKVIGVKLIWTVDAQKSLDFINNYKSKSDMLFIHINWNGDGGVYSISKKAQNEILEKYGKNFYFKLPKQGTNPRGLKLQNKQL